LFTNEALLANEKRKYLKIPRSSLSGKYFQGNTYVHFYLFLICKTITPVILKGGGD
jgi:hypothetical protein